MGIVSRIVEYVQPLQRKLPLLIAALLCAVVGTFGWLAHEELERVVRTAAAERLAAASNRLAGMLAESAARLRAEGHRLATDPTVIASLEHPGNATTTGAAAVLSQQAPAPSPRVSRALWTRACELRLTTGPLATIAGISPCLERTAAVDSDDALRVRTGVQPLVARGDTVLYVIVEPVLRAVSDTIGFMVQVRNLAGGTSGQAIGGLIGKDATLVLGNARGAAVWTDLVKRIAVPAGSEQRGGVITHVAPDGLERLGIAVDVPGTPWLAWVQIPVASAMGGLYKALIRIAAMGLVCVLLGVIGAWALGTHVSGPIVELTRAEEDFAAGDYSRRVASTRRDELGQLMTSFNRMAEHVESATHELTEQAEELAHHFHEAQDLAHELELSNQELIEAANETTIAHRDRASAQSLLDEVLAQAPVGIAVFDANLRFVRVNQAFAAMDGVSEQDHIGRQPGAIVPALSRVAEPQLRRVLATGETMANQRASGAFDGGAKRHWLGSYFPVRGPAGDVTGAGAVLVDTTAHFNLEAQLLQAQKMEAVGQLAGGVAHDFNNLLTVISSYSEMALESLSVEDALHADMKEIRSAAERASRLTRQLLAFSRKQVLQPQVLDLNRVASEMERMLRRLIGEDVTLALEPGADLGHVRADPGQVEQVIMNLALNARDAMPDGGRLVISTANLTLAAALELELVTVPAGEYVTLSVTDSGTGMTDDTRAHLFEPFYTTKGTGHGTGLGLSTVYGIIKQSGGEIGVRSTPGRGSTFTAFLPRAHGASATRSASVVEFAHVGTETLLLVEDDGALRDLARRILRGAGYTVLEARTASVAIELGTTHPGVIDLLLTDVVMPQQNGRAVSERLVRLRPDLRVLFMSGYTDDDVMKRGVSASEMWFLQKPFTPEQLLRRVREVLDDHGRLAS